MGKRTANCAQTQWFSWMWTRWVGCKSREIFRFSLANSSSHMHAVKAADAKLKAPTWHRVITVQDTAWLLETLEAIDALRTKRPKSYIHINNIVEVMLWMSHDRRWSWTYRLYCIFLTDSPGSPMCSGLRMLYDAHKCKWATATVAADIIHYCMWINMGQKQSRSFY